jgi:hypothetical protein
MATKTISHCVPAGRTGDRHQLAGRAVVPFREQPLPVLADGAHHCTVGRLGRHRLPLLPPQVGHHRVRSSPVANVWHRSQVGTSARTGCGVVPVAWLRHNRNHWQHPSGAVRMLARTAVFVMALPSL